MEQVRNFSALLLILPLIVGVFVFAFVAGILDTFVFPPVSKVLDGVIARAERRSKILQELENQETKNVTIGLICGNFIMIPAFWFVFSQKIPDFFVLPLSVFCAIIASLSLAIICVLVMADFDKKEERERKLKWEREINRKKGFRLI